MGIQRESDRLMVPNRISRSRGRWIRHAAPRPGRGSRRRERLLHDALAHGRELFPELCGMSKAAGVVPHLPKYVDVKWKLNELTNTGVTGDPTKATPEKGREMREAMVEAVVKSISALDATNWDYRSPEVVKGR